MNSKRPPPVCWGQMLTKSCNLCGWGIIRLNRSVLGTRCVRCLSTQIHRAVGIVLESLNVGENAEVYELSSRGALLRFLQRNYKNLYFSEYFADVPPGGMRRGVPCQDVQKLVLPDGTFDLVTCTEVFEHVPDDRRGFKEIYRILKEEGRFVFTVPLRNDEETLERACLGCNGEIVLLEEPEFHFEWVRGKKRVLAFRTYGRDITKRLSEAGFFPEIRIVEDPRHGIMKVPVVVAVKR